MNLKRDHLETDVLMTLTLWKDLSVRRRSEKAFDDSRWLFGGKRRRRRPPGGAQELLTTTMRAIEEKGFLVSVGSSNIPFSLFTTLKEDRATFSSTL